MNGKTYYFINDGINPDKIYGDEYPVCLDYAEVQHLSREWETDLFEQMHEASAKEIAEYGVYDTPVWNSYGVQIDYNVAVSMMDDEIRGALHMELAPCTDQEFFDAYAKAHQERFCEEWEADKPHPAI